MTSGRVCASAAEPADPREQLAGARVHLAVRARVTGRAVVTSLPCGHGCSPRSCASPCHADRGVRPPSAFHLPCGQGCSPRSRQQACRRAQVYASTQLFFTLPCGQEFASAHLPFSLPCGRVAIRAAAFQLAMRAGLQAAQPDFPRLPCGGVDPRRSTSPFRAGIASSPYPAVALVASLRGALRRVRSSRARDVVFSIDEVTCVLSLPSSQKKEEETSALRQKSFPLTRDESLSSSASRARRRRPRGGGACAAMGTSKNPAGGSNVEIYLIQAHAEGVAARHAEHGASRRHPPGCRRHRTSARETASRTAKQRDADVDARNRLESHSPVSCLRDTPGRHHPPSTPLTSSHVRPVARAFGTRSAVRRFCRW